MKLKCHFEKKYFEYKTPISVGKRFLTENTALKITINDRLTVELTFLPHFHQHTIDEVQFFLARFFEDSDFCFDQIDLTKPFFNTLKNFSPLPLEREFLYAAESVLYATLFSDEKIPSIQINGLYHKELAIPKTDCLKIKIRPGDVYEAIDVMDEALKMSGKNIRFRLDGNRTFELEPLLRFLEKVPSHFLIEYIEEPFKNFSDYFNFKKFSSISIALDESLLFLLSDFDKLDIFKDDFFIAKPSLLSLSTTFALMEKYPSKVIISSTYEFPSLMKALYKLSSKNPDQFHGLDTEKFLPK